MGALAVEGVGALGGAERRAVRERDRDDMDGGRCAGGVRVDFRAHVAVGVVEGLDLIAFRADLLQDGRAGVLVSEIERIE